MNRIIFRINTALFILLAVAGFSSCMISSRSEVGVLNSSKYSGSVSVKSIRVPLFIGKPVLKTYLRFEEDVPWEVVDLLKGIRKVRVTVAETSNERLIKDFRSAVKEMPGEEWISVHNGTQWVSLKGDKQDDNMIRRLTVAVSDPETNRLAFINIKCKLTPDQLSTLLNFAMHSDEGKRFLAAK